MKVIDKIRAILTESGISFSETDRSLITTCVICGKAKHLYLFLDPGNGYGKCMRCGVLTSPTTLISQIKHCSYEEAQEIIAAGTIVQHTSGTALPLLGVKTEPPSETSVPTFILPFTFYELKDGEYAEAWAYLNMRGIHPTIVKQYHLMYAPEMQRIIIPIFYDNKCVGWQGRDITGLEKDLPYMFPSGFRRAQVLIGINQINPAVEHLILAEGAFDWLKVAILGNAVCSMGKNVSLAQIKLMQSLPNIKRIYIALDPDAWDSFDRILANREHREVWLMVPPNDKKDFGECTDAEVNYAFHNAKKYEKQGDGHFISGKILNKGRIF